MNNEKITNKPWITRLQQLDHVPGEEPPDIDLMWTRLQAKLHPQKKQRYVIHWAAAGIMILLCFPWRLSDHKVIEPAMRSTAGVKQPANHPTIEAITPSSSAGNKVSVRKDQFAKLVNNHPAQKDIIVLAQNNNTIPNIAAVQQTEKPMPAIHLNDLQPVIESIQTVAINAVYIAPSPQKVKENQRQINESPDEHILINTQN